MKSTASPGSSGKSDVIRRWLWQPHDGVLALPRDPAALPSCYAEAEKAFVQEMRGPKIAQIVPVEVIKLKGAAALLQLETENKPRVVHIGQTLPWYEGLLLLSEVEKYADSLGITWHKAHERLLAKEKAHASGNGLSAGTYVKQSLLSVAITGPLVSEEGEDKWQYRRTLRNDAPADLSEGEDNADENSWGFRNILQFIPPWEAFCNPKCGIYQDYYLVAWAEPHSKADYGSMENGWSSGVGATWEPDECLPFHLDGLRMSAKHRWLVSQLKQEREVISNESSVPKSTPSAASGESAAARRLREDDDNECHSMKRRRSCGDEPELERLWDTVVSMINVPATAKDIVHRMHFTWTPRGGTLAKQLMRLIDASIREKRLGITGLILRTLLRTADKGVLSESTFLATEAVCALGKEKRYKLQLLEAIISDMAKSATQSSDLMRGILGSVAWTLVHMFPVKQQDSSWGWSHASWTWTMWWDFVGRCLHEFPPNDAFDILRTMAEVMLAQVPLCTALRDLPTWVDDPMRVRELRRRLRKTAGLSDDALLRELEHLGIEDRPTESASMA